MIRAAAGGRLNIHRVSSQPVLRAAVIGAGVFGRHHAAKYRAIPGIDLQAIADIDSGARAQAMASFHIPAVADWRELLGKVDLVSVCSPAITHAEIVRGFLNSGAHVLVEKPIATTTGEADQLIALARSRGLVLTVGHQERYVLARSGLLQITGAPAYIECVREGPWTGRGTDVSVVLDLMIHDLDLVHSLMPGAVAELRAEGRFVYGQSYDAVNAKLVFGSGATVELTANRAADERKRSLRIGYVDGGEIAIDFLTRKFVNTTRTALSLAESADPLAELIAAFVSAVRAGAPVIVRPEEALRALETALLIEESLVPTVLSRKQRALRRTA